MIHRSKAPLRIGLAGGGTDVSPYCDIYGGAILNASISLYAYASIEPVDEPTITIEAKDRNETATYDKLETLPIDGHLDLAKGIYNRIVREYGHVPSGFRLTRADHTAQHAVGHQGNEPRGGRAPVEAG